MRRLFLFSVDLQHDLQKLFYVLHAVTSGSPNFFIRGPHKLIHNRSRAGHLTQLIVAGYVILPNQQVFRKYIIFSFMAKCLRGLELAPWP